MTPKWTAIRVRAYASWMRSLALVMIVASLVGCGGPQTPASTAPRIVATAPPPPVEVSEPVIHRAVLEQVLDAGLGAFLGRVGTEPSLDGNRFVGFRIIALRDATLFDGVDLRAGDVLVSVNGQPIERPEQAFTAWTSLRVASEITLAVMRDGERRDLRFPIVD